MQSNIAEMLGRNRLPDLDGTNNRIALRRGLFVQGALSTLADSSLRGGIGGEGIGMPCRSCGSVNQRKFSAEMGIHFFRLKNIDKPVVWVFPKLVVCLDCGTAEFVLPDAELCLLAKGDAAAAG